MSPTMMRTQTTIVTMVVALTVRPPSNSVSDGRSMRFGNVLGSLFQMSSAAFSRK